MTTTTMIPTSLPARHNPSTGEAIDAGWGIWDTEMMLRLPVRFDRHEEAQDFLNYCEAQGCEPRTRPTETPEAYDHRFARLLDDFARRRGDRLTAVELLRLAADAMPRSEEDWGSVRQVAAENAFTEYCDSCGLLDSEAEQYCSKATSEEIVLYFVAVAIPRISGRLSATTAKMVWFCNSPLCVGGAVRASRLMHAGCEGWPCRPENRE